MSVTVTFTCDNMMILFQEMAIMLHSIPAFDIRDPVEPVPEIETKSGTVVSMSATAGEPPRRRRGKGNGEQIKAAPDPVEEAVAAEEAAEEAVALSRDQVIERLTLIFKGADAGTRAKIKDWRTKMGYSLIRDMTDADVPSALKLIDDLVAAAG